MYCNAIDNVDLCLSFFENKRGAQLNLTTNQNKYLSVTHRLMLASRDEIMPPLPLTPNECIMLSVALVGVPMFNRIKNGCTPFVEIYMKI